MTVALGLGSGSNVSSWWHVLLIQKTAKLLPRHLARKFQRTCPNSQVRGRYALRALAGRVVCAYHALLCDPHNHSCPLQLACGGRIPLEQYLVDGCDLLVSQPAAQGSNIVSRLTAVPMACFRVRHHTISDNALQVSYWRLRILPTLLMRWSCQK